MSCGLKHIHVDWQNHWIYQSNRHYASLRRIDLIRQQELQNENWPELENGVACFKLRYIVWETKKYYLTLTLTEWVTQARS
ncbi:unnamed protein product [Arctia plantaginis]|uniref:Uncharacterized protein n=1 Tax=Arctia plantaginis TaxID=874455 RepID=A0A8S0Z8U8_ARCPL|nr:unnamed protein product [Arctia plantaginis]